ncbi:MAG: hypothetical protein AABX23_04135 [Nanoarchaeota archaeon]
MKINDEIFVAGGILIRTKPVSDLLEKMSAKNICFDPPDCLQVVSYITIRASQDVPIPLHWAVGKGGYVKAYTLRNQELSIDLRDYQAYHQGMPGAIGGSRSTGKPGVMCKLEYCGGQEGAKIVQDAKLVLQDFYGGRVWEQ